MTRDESLQLTSMVLSHWPNEREWGTDEIEAFAKGIGDLDAEIATSALIRAHKTEPRRPNLATFRSWVRSEKRRLAPEVPEREASKGTPFPPWVRRWICARLLYAEFGKARDDRRFAEQHDFGDLHQETMPEGAWEEEAASLSDEELLAKFRSLSASGAARGVGGRS